MQRVNGEGKGEGASVRVVVAPGADTPHQAYIRHVVDENAPRNARAGGGVGGSGDVTAGAGEV